MKLKHWLASNGEFARQALTLMTGTVVAQAIPVVFSPILTRLYSPSEFGIFAAFVAVSAVLAIASTGRYELAIVIPRRHATSSHVLYLSLLISLAWAAVLITIFVGMALLGDPSSNFQIGGYIYLLPISVFLIGLYQSLTYWFNRNQNYKSISFVRIVQSVTITSVSLWIGYFYHAPGGLIVGVLVGQFASCLCFIIMVNRNSHLRLGPFRAIIGLTYQTSKDMEIARQAGT